MRRGVGIVLVGLGVFFVALALLLRFYVVPSLLVTPIDQFAESFAPGTGTVFNPATLVEEDNVDMVAHRTLRGDVAASSDDVGVWDESLLLEKTDGSLINASTDRVAWDRKTGEAVHCCGEAVDGVPTRHEGLSYKFPFGTEKKTYQFFDTTAKKAYPMTYKGSEQIQGLTVYRFEQPVGPVQIGESEVPGSLVGESAPSVTVPRFYDNLRTVWVEPVTGVIVKGQEVQHQVFRDAAGADAVTLVDVTLTFNEKTQKQQADLAKDGRSKKALLGTWAPLALILLGVILLVVGLVILARRDDGAAEGRGSRRRDPVAV
jgi:Porin PorA